MDYLSIFGLPIIFVIVFIGSLLYFNSVKHLLDLLKARYPKFLLDFHIEDSWLFILYGGYFTKLLLLKFIFSKELQAIQDTDIQKKRKYIIWYSIIALSALLLLIVFALSTIVYLWI